MMELNNWDIQFSGIRGELVGEGKTIRTSPIVSREDNVITTKSGNTYKLLECYKDAYIQLQEIRDLYWEGAKDIWECLDVQIKNNNSRKETKE